MMSFLKKPFFILTLILIAFLFREFFFAGMFPFFTGQDEARHYNTVQWLSQEHEPACGETDWNITIQEKDDLATYRFSEEIRETSLTSNTRTWREENYRKPEYVSGNIGAQEYRISDNNWSKDTPCPPDIALSSSQISLFHWLGSGVERVWAESDISVRFYLVRLLSVLFGTATILFAYFAAVEAGFSRRISLLITFIISLQPRLSIYTTNINYDTLLIPSFTLFVWGSMRWLRQGFTWTNLILILGALAGAVLTKGTGLILLSGIFFLAGWEMFKKRYQLRQISPRYLVFSLVLLFILILSINSLYNFSRLFPEFSFVSLWEYLGKSTPRIPSSSENFWGVLSWNEATFGPFFVYLIWFIELLALGGLIRYFSRQETSSFLPLKQVALFCLTLLIALQFGVRFHDWHVFQVTDKLALGTPGRYFLPTILPQFLLLTIGLGALLKKQIFLERTLVALALAMLTFNLYTFWLIIIPRFYL